MIFLRYENVRTYIRLYPVTTFFLLANATVFLLMVFSGGSKDYDTLIRFGAMYDAAPYDAQWWRYLTAVFVHIGFEHWLFNSFAIYVFAPPLERIMGRTAFFALYLLSGVAGNVVSDALHHIPNLISAGASGAIFGVYGAFIFMGLFRKDLLDRQSRKIALVILGVGAVYSVVVPHIDFYAHLGGFAAGFLLFGLLRRK